MYGANDGRKSQNRYFRNPKGQDEIEQIRKRNVELNRGKRFPDFMQQK